VKRAAATLRRTATGGLAVIPAVLAEASWHALAAMVLAVLTAVVAVCWVIADNDRARRLAMLIGAWRGEGLAASSQQEPALASQEGQQAAGR
jgi:hypothetical protein